MHFALICADAESLRGLLAELAGGELECNELFNLARLAAVNMDHLAR